MFSPARRALGILSLNLATGFILATAGCGGESAKQAIDRQIKENPQLKSANVAQFAGQVTIDGQPPSQEVRLFVILNDPQHLDENAHLRAPRLCAVCEDDGKFAFSTLDKGDGVPAGKYVVTFVELHRPTAVKSSGGRMRQGTGSRHFLGPDELKNLYNDPDKNQKEERFNLNLEPPGKADYVFDLAVAGKETAAPGPNAVTTIMTPR
jgi:hypothetical protein